MPTKSTLARFRRLVITWFRRQGRDLPWRRTRDPYRILISEVMLQQTPVSRVETYYPGFLRRYPTIRDLARASPAMVRESWDGLGYYRRAENLHRAARTIVDRFTGVIPEDAAWLRALPGVGPYTAGAILAFAHEAAVPAVDTNVARVLRRAFHPRSGSTARHQRRIWATAKALLPRRGPTAWALNQGLMELGARVCTARRARCESCPVARECATGRRAIKGASTRR
jgi:A/G-specific adenine glycosylase